MTLRVCCLALLLAACSSEGLETPTSTDTSSLPACDSLSTESDCKARADCLANECGFCGGTEYLGCTDPGQAVGCPAPPASCPATCPSQVDAKGCAAHGCTSVYEADLTFEGCVNAGQSCTDPGTAECFWTVTCPDGYAPLYDRICAEYCIAASDCAS